MFWEYIGAFLSGVGSVLGAVWVVRAVVRHEKTVSDTRMQAFKDGLRYRDEITKGDADDGEKSRGS